jgi:hypothetical protein
VLTAVHRYAQPTACNVVPMAPLRNMSGADPPVTGISLSDAALIATRSPLGADHPPRAQWAALAKSRASHALLSARSSRQALPGARLLSALAGLVAPSKDEHALIAAGTPCWAQVAPHRVQQLVGGSGALGCTYTPDSVAEAIAILGFERILIQIEAFTSATGWGLLAQVVMQQDRQAQLVAVERELGWMPDPRRIRRARRRGPVCTRCWYRSSREGQPGRRHCL